MLGGLVCGTKPRIKPVQMRKKKHSTKCLQSQIKLVCSSFHVLSCPHTGCVVREDCSGSVSAQTFFLNKLRQGCPPLPDRPCAQHVQSTRRIRLTVKRPSTKGFPSFVVPINNTLSHERGGTKQRFSFGKYQARSQE